MYAFDLSVFNSIHSLAGHSGLMDGLILFTASYLPWLMGAAVIWWAYREFEAGERVRMLGYVRALVIAFVARFVVAGAIRLFWHRPRPFIALGVPHLITDYAYSFPSGHAIFFFGLSTGVFFVNKRFGYILFVLSVLVGIARVAAGVHYPSDIVGGAVLGIGTAYVVRSIWRLRLKSV